MDINHKGIITTGEKEAGHKAGEKKRWKV